MIKNVTLSALLILLLSAITLPVNAQKDRKEGRSSTPLIEITTEYGKMVLRLYDETPLHRDNFLKLAREGFYDSLLFHRIISGFMIQGGDPESKNAEAGKMLGNGDVGYTVPAEFNDSLYHKKGALCAARTENPEKASSGCQFYIVQGKPLTDADLNQMEETISGQRKQSAMGKALSKPENAEVKNKFMELKRANQPDSLNMYYKTVVEPLVAKEIKPFKYSATQRNMYKTVGGTLQLDQGYTVYGELIEGMDVLDKIAAVKTATADRPEKDVRMTVKVLEKPGSKMQEHINAYIKEVESFTPEGKKELEEFRLKFLSKKGIMGELFSKMKDIDAGERKEFGQLVNELKNKAEEKFALWKDTFEDASAEATGTIDFTLPGEPHPEGSRHPVSLVKNEICTIFERIGFSVSDGPEIEDDWHNFSALNFPPEHPARDMQDTFFIEKDPDIALRTHTSSVQVRVMETQKPPIRVICPGRVYRNEAISARAHCFFHQVEGLYIDKKVSFADLKQTLLYFAREMFGADTKIRLRPSYFPFTEPSAEMDISCTICKGKGCNVCKYTGWVEIMGCGMVDPAVLDLCKIDSTIYSGYAFGMGIERITMLKYSIKDLRLFSENDVRFLKQFSGK